MSEQELLRKEKARKRYELWLRSSQRHEDYRKSAITFLFTAHAGALLAIATLAKDNIKIFFIPSILFTCGTVFSIIITLTYQEGYHILSECLAEEESPKQARKIKEANTYAEKGKHLTIITTMLFIAGCLMPIFNSYSDKTNFMTSKSTPKPQPTSPPLTPHSSPLNSGAAKARLRLDAR